MARKAKTQKNSKTKSRFPPQTWQTRAKDYGFERIGGLEHTPKEAMNAKVQNDRNGYCIRCIEGWAEHWNVKVHHVVDACVARTFEWPHLTKKRNSKGLLGGGYFERENEAHNPLVPDDLSERLLGASTLLNELKDEMRGLDIFRAPFRLESIRVVAVNLAAAEEALKTSHHTEDLSERAEAILQLMRDTAYARAAVPFDFEQHHVPRQRQ